MKTKSKSRVSYGRPHVTIIPHTHPSHNRQRETSLEREKIHNLTCTFIHWVILPHTKVKEEIKLKRYGTDLEYSVAELNIPKYNQLSDRAAGFRKVWASASVGHTVVRSMVGLVVVTVSQPRR